MQDTKASVTTLANTHPQLIDSFLAKVEALNQPNKLKLAISLVRGNPNFKTDKKGSASFRKLVCDHFGIADYFSIFTPQALATMEEMKAVNQERNKTRHRYASGDRTLTVMARRWQAILKHCKSVGISYEIDGDSVRLDYTVQRKKTATYMKSVIVTAEQVTEIGLSGRAGISLPE